MPATRPFNPEKIVNLASDQRPRFKENNSISIMASWLEEALDDLNEYEGAAFDVLTAFVHAYPRIEFTRSRSKRILDRNRMRKVVLSGKHDEIYLREKEKAKEVLGPTRRYSILSELCLEFHNAGLRDCEIAELLDVAGFETIAGDPEDVRKLINERVRRQKKRQDALPPRFSRMNRRTDEPDSFQVNAHVTDLDALDSDPLADAQKDKEDPYS